MARSENLLLFWVLLLLIPLAFSELDGDAVVEKNGLLRLTNVTHRVVGHAFYRSPVRFRNATDGKALSFSTAFAFAIFPEYPTLGGHGLAFTLSPNRGLPGARHSQYLGLLNSTNMGNSTNHVFAVEFDTVLDSQFGDIDDNHVGVDINSLTSSCSVPATYFTRDSTQEEINLKSGKVIQAWIDFDSGKKQLTVMLSPSSTKPKSPILSYDIDLSPVLNDFMYIGFSSSTGLLASTHYLLGWSFNMNGEARSLSLSSLPKLPGSKKNHTALIVGVTVAAVVVLFLVLGFWFYLNRKKKNSV